MLFETVIFRRLDWDAVPEFAAAGLEKWGAVLASFAAFQNAQDLDVFGPAAMTVGTFPISR